MNRNVLVFVSHSRHSDAGLFREAFVQALESEGDGRSSGFEARVDTDLLAGLPWQPQLYEWMAEVHAAVILLNEAAIISEHVLQEATSLIWRAFLDKDFVLLPVRLGVVDEDALRGGPMGPLEIHRIEWLSAEDPAELAVRVKQLLGDLKARLKTVRTPLERLIQALAARLKTADPAGLDELVDGLLIDEPAWRPGQGKAIDYPSIIARRLVRNGASLGRFNNLAELVDHLRETSALSKEYAKEVLDYIAPLWVCAESAAVLPEIAKRPAETRWAAAMNGARVSDYTCEMFIARAYPATKRYHHSPLAGGYDDSNLKKQLESQLRTELKRELKATDDGADLDDKLSRVHDPYFVTLAPGEDYGRALPEILAKYPMLTFILHTGHVLDASKLPERTVAIHPAVEVEDEKTRAEDYGWALELAGR